VGLLDGAFVFLADLARRLTMAHDLDFVVCSSYGSGTVSSGEVILKRDLTVDVKGRQVLLVDDLCDTGNTLRSLKELMLKRKAASVRTCCLLNKPSRRVADVHVDFVGKDIPDAFVVGYGMDFDKRFRSLPFVGVLKKELYQTSI